MKRALLVLALASAGCSPFRYQVSTAFNAYDLADYHWKRDCTTPNAPKPASCGPRADALNELLDAAELADKARHRGGRAKGQKKLLREKREKVEALDGVH